MKKTYARQIAPEHQESPLFLSDEFPDGLILAGNRHYRSHSTDEYEILIAHIGEAFGDLEDIGTDNQWYKNATELFHDMFTPTHKERYSTKEIAEWKEIIIGYNSCRAADEYKYFCLALSLMTGNKYDYMTIRGCYQGDWQEVYYPKNLYSSEFMSCFETEYFNMGSEWIVHAEEYEPKEPEDIIGYTMYCYTYEPVKEIAESEGVDIEDVVAYIHDGYTKHDKYRLA